MKKLTPVLMVEEIEPCLPFWTEGLGFEKTVDVPEGDRLGFVILTKGGIELMLQTRSSVQNDIPAIAELLFPSTPCLFVEVEDLEAAAARVRDAEVLVPRRETFYGMAEIVVRAPGGPVVVFAQQLKKD